MSCICTLVFHVRPVAIFLADGASQVLLSRLFGSWLLRNSRFPKIAFIAGFRGYSTMPRRHYPSRPFSANRQATKLYLNDRAVIPEYYPSGFRVAAHPGIRCLKLGRAKAIQRAVPEAI
jgi:hypothetical protein